MEYLLWQLGHILHKFHEDSLSHMVAQRNIYYSHKVNVEGKDKLEYEPKRMVCFNINTEDMTYDFGITKEMTPTTLEEVKFVGNGLGRTSKKCAPYFWLSDFWKAPFFDVGFYSDVLYWRDKNRVTLYEEETMKKIEEISKRFLFKEFDAQEALNEQGISNKDYEKMGIVILSIDGQPLHEDLVFQKEILQLISNFKDVNQSQEYTCAITNRQNVALSSDTGKTIMKFHTQTDPYHFQFNAAINKNAMNNFLLSKKAQLEYMIGSKYIENYLSMYPVVRNIEGVDAAYVIPSFEEPLNEDDEEIVYGILLNRKEEYQNSKGSRGFTLEGLINWQQTFDELLEEKTITFEILLISTPSGAYKVVNHFSKIDFSDMKRFRIRFNEEIDSLRFFNYNKKHTLEDIIGLKATTNVLFINQVLEIALYGNRFIHEPSFVRNLMELVKESITDFQKSLIQNKAKDVEERVQEYRDNIMLMFDSLYRTLQSLNLFTGGRVMEKVDRDINVLVNNIGKYNQKYEDYANKCNCTDAERALIYLGGVIRNIFKIEKKRKINPTHYDVQSLNTFSLEQLINQLYLRIDLFEREEYEGYYPSVRKLLDNAILLLGNITLTTNGLTPPQITRFIYLGSAIANLYVEISEEKQEENKGNIPV